MKASGAGVNDPAAKTLAGPGKLSRPDRTNNIAC